MLRILWWEFYFVHGTKLINHQIFLLRMVHSHWAWLKFEFLYSLNDLIVVMWFSIGFIGHWYHKMVILWKRMSIWIIWNEIESILDLTQFKSWVFCFEFIQFQIQIAFTSAIHWNKNFGCKMDKIINPTFTFPFRK